MSGWLWWPLVTVGLVLLVLGLNRVFLWAENGRPPHRDDIRAQVRQHERARRVTSNRDRRWYRTPDNTDNTNEAQK